MEKFFNRKILKLLFFILTGIIVSAEEQGKPPVIPMIPILPALPADKGEEKQPAPREVKTVIMKMEAEVVVPLEIISDIEIQAMVIDEQEIKVPFEVEFNKEPDKNNFYKLNYSETEIDIDKDGTPDTFIYSNPGIKSKIHKDDYVLIKGKNISKEGYHEKIIYITVETHD